MTNYCAGKAYPGLSSFTIKVGVVNSDRPYFLQAIALESGVAPARDDV
ncbi:hypothetical protein [Cylindrospermopsis raciborskii]|nr:hypothetical protein [Cylindrospermopsis raciborskii]MCZ2206002.1 hypothetical protein [Cylindrospermopsis raciborskii PAMP2011]